MAILPPGFILDRSGNFGIMTALLMAPLLGAAGMAVDVAHALSLRTQLYAAADAAAVGSIAEKSGAVAAAMAMSGNGTISFGKTDAHNIFMSQMSGELSDIQVDLDIDVTKAANKLNSQVSFTATVPTTFMRVLGRESITISGMATAEYQTASFMDFYILLDNTPSMGVGATAKDVATMEKNTSDSCAFACHETQNSNNYYNLAKKLGVSMRIDVRAPGDQGIDADRQDDAGFRKPVPHGRLHLRHQGRRRQADDHIHSDGTISTRCAPTPTPLI